MLRIIKVQPTVGKASTVAVLVSDKKDDHLHNTLNKYFKEVHGDYVSIQYVEQFAVPCVSTAGYKIDAIINADELMENI